MRDGTPIHWQGIAIRYCCMKPSRKAESTSGGRGSSGAGAPPPAARRLTDASTLASASRQD
eukprot:550847-Karenia_brevis.AAC.1